jgi:hypothetical protein
MTDNQWNHIVVTWDTSAEEFKGYINGNTEPVFSKTINVTGGQWTPDAQVMQFGKDHEGSMDEIAIFNAVLDGDAVAAVYNSGKPFNLNNDRGNYDNSSALQGYWRMGNGLFDDIANGVVHDAHNPGYGSELWDGTDDSQWSLAQAGNNTKTTLTDGTIQFTWVDDDVGGHIYFRDSDDLTADLTIGATYKCTFETKTSTGTNNWHINDGAASGSVNYTSNPSNVTTGDFQSQVIYFRAQHAQNAYLILTNMGSGEVTQIKNISLKKLNGYPGLTQANATFSADTPDD